jgi:glycosyltransferase involved in cell wall biosynthesis
MNEKITVLMPTYRRPEFLRRAMLSVLGQTYNNLKIVVFDNASGDNTEKIVKDLSRNDSRIVYHCHENNMGMLKNFKYAFGSISTPYFAFLTDDDFLAKDCYERAVNVLESHPDIMFVLLDRLFVDEHVNLVGVGVSDISNQVVFYRDENRFDAVHSDKIPLTCISAVYRKEVANIYLDMDDRFDIGSDIRFLFHAAARFNFAVLSKVGAFVTIHSGSFSVLKNNFNLVHKGVIISRYVEIINDNEISEYIRFRAAFYLRELLSNNNCKPMLKGALRRLISGLMYPTDLKKKIVEVDIKYSKEAGFLRTSKVLNFINKQIFIGTTVRFLFGNYLKKRKQRNKAHLFEMQSLMYKEAFDSIKKIKSIDLVTDKDLNSN